MAISIRKHDITRRHALQKRAKEDRENKILQNEQIEQKRQDYLEESKAQFRQDHLEEFEAYEKWVARQQKLASGQQVEEEEDEQKEPPSEPKLDIESLGKQYDEQYPKFEVPAPIVLDQDTDWKLSQEAHEEILAAFQIPAQ